MDHFGKDAWTTYKAGHSLALRFAKEGKGDVEKLKKAYLYDAFALHYLTDQFASGHIRTARPEFNYPSYLCKYPIDLFGFPDSKPSSDGTSSGQLPHRITSIYFQDLLRSLG